MPYLWAASLKGSITVKGVEQRQDVSFADILHTMKYGFIGQAELQRGRFLLLADTVLLKTSEDVSVDVSKAGKFGLHNVTGQLDATADVLNYIQELMLGYRVYERPVAYAGDMPRMLSFDVLGGARFYYIDSDVTAKAKVTIPGPNGGVTKQKEGRLSGSENWIDPVVGARVTYDATDRMSLSLRGDVGGFGLGSDLTWGVTALSSYRIAERWHMYAGYRVLDINYSNGDRGMDAQMAGPILGLQYRISF